VRSSIIYEVEFTITYTWALLC